MNFTELLSPGDVIKFFTNIAILLSGVIYCIITMKRNISDFKKENEKELQHVSKTVKRQSEIDLLIYKEMEKAKEILNADAICIFEFHNGGHYANGRSALKTTCTFEVLRQGYQSRQRDLAAIPLSVFPISVKELLDNDKLVIKDVSEFSVSHPSLGNFLSQFNIKSSYMKVIKNEIGNPVGAVVVSYINNPFSSRHSVIDRLIWFIEDKLISSLNK